MIHIQAKKAKARVENGAKGDVDGPIFFFFLEEKMGTSRVMVKEHAHHDMRFFPIENRECPLRIGNAQ